MKMERVTEFAKQNRKPKSEGDKFPETRYMLFQRNIPVISSLSRGYTVPCPVPFTDRSRLRVEGDVEGEVSRADTSP